MLNLNDLEKEYLELKKENFQDGKRIKFIANLGASDEIAYHYELICKEWQEGRQLNLESSFDRHGGAGLEFLFERLAKESDQKLKIETIYLIAQILTKSKHRDFYTAFLQGISSEKEPYACAIMIEAAQNLFGKKWISSSTAQNQNKEKIEKARKSAVRFLSKS